LRLCFVSLFPPFCFFPRPYAHFRNDLTEADLVETMSGVGVTNLSANISTKKQTLSSSSSSRSKSRDSCYTDATTAVRGGYVGIWVCDTYYLWGCVWVGLCVCLWAWLGLCVCVSVCLFMSVTGAVCLCVCVSVCLFMSVTESVCLCMSVTYCLWLCVSVCECRYDGNVDTFDRVVGCDSVCMCLCVCVSVYVSLCMCLCVCVSPFAYMFVPQHA